MSPTVEASLRRSGYDPDWACVMVPPCNDPIAPPLAVVIGYLNADESQRWMIWCRVAGRYVLTQDYAGDYVTPIRLLGRPAGSC